MRAIFLTQTGPCGASARYRVYQFVPALREAGIEVTVAPAVSDALASAYAADPSRHKRRYYATIIGRRFVDLLLLRKFDVVFVQRDFLVHAYPLLERLASWLQPRMVFDVDDATWNLPTAKRPGRLLRWLHDPEKIRRIARWSRHVIAGNEVIADHVRENADVTVIPTSIDVDRYESIAPPPKDPDRPVIGWMGSQGTVGYLEAILPALRQLAARHRFELLIVGGRLSSRPGEFAIRERPWDLEREVQDLKGMDVGLMPLEDDAWSRGKSATKLLQYMAARVPSVASPVGANAEILQDGVNGFAPRSESEWVQVLDRLLADAALRRQIGDRGFETVSARYSLRVAAPRLVEVLRRASGTPGAT